MALLWLIGAALAGLFVGYLIGRCWNNVDEADAYHEGELAGFAEGFDRGQPVHQTPTEKITA